jgi:hypothetical protein
MIKYIYDSEAEVPEAIKGEYVQRDGKWVLQVDGAVGKSVHDQFRTNNINLTRERDELKGLKTSLEEAGITIEDAIRLKGIEDDLKAEKLLKKGEIDKIMAERLSDVTKKHDKVLKDEQKRVAELTKELEVMRIDEAAVALALKNGLEDTAVDDIKARARRTFKLVDGKAKAIGEDGTEIYQDGEPLSFERWIQGLKPNYPHLFKRSTGGGGVPGRATGGPINTGINPWSKATFNLTEQGKIAKANPELADRMKASAER